jgi:hypothetical protein
MSRNAKIIGALITMAIGVALIAFGIRIIGIVLSILGAFFIIRGILAIITRSDLIGCIINCAIGAVIVTGGWMFVAIMLIILAVALIVIGIVWLIKLIKRHTKGKNVLTSILTYLMPIGCILIGACFFFNGTAFVDTAFVIAGVLIFIDGLAYLFNTMKGKA